MKKHLFFTTLISFQFIFFAQLIFTAQLSFAKTIIITDVDDTIKDSRIRNTSEMIKRSVRTGPDMVVIEMNQVLAEARRKFAVPSIFYVSKVPPFMSDFHIDFLNRNDFPPGALKSWNYEPDYKFITISEIINIESPTLVILIGDNGESDPDVYNRISKKYSGRGIEFKTYIRKAYKNNYHFFLDQELFTNGLDLRQIMRLPPKNTFDL
ncbi:MAG: DUF2183 domain-containing protein [Bdellovibrionales bacterium]|nr:DUF2183 domain-containing protein [Bdellovibrionales bacterium]